MLFLFALLTLTGRHAIAQSSTSELVPVGTPVAASYQGLYRPQVHFSPPQGFMNDPNGMFVDGDGLYHLYYQYNPTNTIAGNQHWGHATSSDLYHWTNQQIALFPYGNVTGIYSGSAVIDTNNTSGFFPNQTNGVVAVYTANGVEQNQAIAYSHDNGYTFTQYAKNPVLAIGSPSFRDPKVFWHPETSRWVMAVSFADEFTIAIYTSRNLLNWSFASNFSNAGITGLQYECPNLIQIPMENSSTPFWLMYISLQPGAPMGGSIGQYFPGTFNGTHFTAIDRTARIADFGKDNYATQFFEGIPGTDDQISIAWASNWQYTNQVPSGPAEGWQSSMSLPRRNFLANGTRAPYTLYSVPCDMSSILVGDGVRNKSLGNGTLAATFDDNSGSIGSGAYLIQVNITNLNASTLPNTASLNISITNSATGAGLRAGQFFAGDPAFWMNRGAVGGGFENPFFTDKASVGLVIGNSWDVQVVVDRSVWEVFLMGGERSATLTFFPEDRLDVVTVRAGGLNADAVVSVAVWELESTWGSGVVQGNRTMAMRRDDRMDRRAFWA